MHKRRLANKTMHLTVAGAYVDFMYTGPCGAYARARALGPEHFPISYYELDEP